MSPKSKLFAIISYFAVLLFLSYGFIRNDEFIKYHLKQGIVMFVLAMLIVFTFWIPVAGWVCLMAYLVIWFTGVINALTGKCEPVPVVGKIAERLPL